MANVRIQPSRALTAYKSDFADIPYPAIATSGSNSGTGTTLTDVSKDFVALNIYAENIVYNISTGASATIIGNPSPTSPNSLLLNDSIMNAGNDYIIYQSSPQAGGQNTGCVLYVGTGGDLEVTTAGGDRVIFVGVPSGTFLPVQVVKVWNTGASADIIALW